MVDVERANGACSGNDGVTMQSLQWNPWSGKLSAPENSMRIMEIGRLQSPPQGKTALVSTIECDSAGARLATAGVQKIVRIFDSRAFLESLGQVSNDSDDSDDQRDDSRYADPDADAERKWQPASTSGRGVGTGSWARRIDRNRPLATVDGSDDAFLLMQYANAAKVSALAWGEGDAVLGCVDYDGIFSRHDVTTGSVLDEGDSHGGRRVWSLRYKSEPAVLGGTWITASEDGTCGVWDGNGQSAVMKFVPQKSGFRRPSVCCADFLSHDKPLVVLALSDSSIQVCDLRYPDASQGCVAGWYAHCGAVSGLRICDGMMVSSSIDSTAALWDVGGPSVEPRLLRRFHGHRNRRNFLGLGLRRDGLVACGSESCEFYVYSKNWDTPMARVTLAACSDCDNFEGGADCSGNGGDNTQKRQLNAALGGADVLASALCWHPDESMNVLFAGCSTGSIHAYNHCNAIQSVESNVWDVVG